MPLNISVATVNAKQNQLKLKPGGVKNFMLKPGSINLAAIKPKPALSEKEFEEKKEEILNTYSLKLLEIEDL
jgi:hypothetical protein